MDTRHLSPLQRLFLWTLRHWGSRTGLPPYVARALRTCREGPNLLGVADRLLSWYRLRGRGQGQLNAPAASAMTSLETQLLAAPWCARHYAPGALRLWLADHFDGAGLAEAPAVLEPLAEALEALGPEALLSPLRVPSAAYGLSPSSHALRAAARSR